MNIKVTSQPVKPLDIVTVSGLKKGWVVVRDGLGREYLRVKTSGTCSFRAAGALGTHLICNENIRKQVVDTGAITLTCETQLNDKGGAYKALLKQLFYTMSRSCGGVQLHLIEGKFYRTFVPWLRDHTHTLKGMKYFYPEIKSGLEMYADSQRKDGLIWDKIAHANPFAYWHDHKFGPGGFVTKINDGQMRFERIPAENDVEYLFVECLYYTWKATGDTEWMKRFLANAKKAVAYGTSDPYRWSKKFGLLKRGYTIDTWDFMAHEDSELTSDNVVDLKKTVFGVMHGDNTGMAMACRYLGEMLTAAGRAKEAVPYVKLEKTLRDRLDTVSWNGEFFTHHVSEDPSFKRDLGVDESKQVSLSNAYACNRGITQEQAAAIIRTYQRIRTEMPESSPGEWYNIYPPFQKGFGSHNGVWNYMNGGVSTIVAGELSRGAFDHGFESYGADILKRLNAIAKNHGGYLDVCFRGNMEPEPTRAFTPVDLRSSANIDFCGAGAPDVPGWTMEGDNDLSQLPTGAQTFCKVPFEVIDPAKNGRRACIGISSRPKYSKEIRVPVNASPASLYFLHAFSGGGAIIGNLKIVYKDGTYHSTYIRSGEQLESWFMPGETRLRNADHAVQYSNNWPPYQIAWRGNNKVFNNLGLFIWGMNNPHPGREISEVVMSASESNALWFVAGITMSDQKVWFPQYDMSYGIPDNWGAAAVVYALFEGLAGVKDTGVGFDKATISPRWNSAGVAEASISVAYPASGGYVHYTYLFNKKKKSVTVCATGTAQNIRFELLLPEKAVPLQLTINGKKREFDIRTVEKSWYLCADLDGVAAHEVEVLFA